MFLGEALDDPDVAPCGICDLCAGPRFAHHVDRALARQAAQFLRRRPVVIAPRKQWPDRQRIPIEYRLEEGRALCRWGDGGWSELVKHGKQVDRQFGQVLVDALADLVFGWCPRTSPEWVTWVPSLNHPGLVADLARRLAATLGVPAVDAVTKTRHTEPQKLMQNSAQQLGNVKDAFEVSALIPGGPVLLVDDIVDSRWTLTYVGFLLRQAGSGPVMPLALADSAQS